MDEASQPARLFTKLSVLKNYIIVQENSHEFKARPLGWNEKGLIGALERAFALRYFLFSNGDMVSEMRYDDINDRFEIQKNGATHVINPRSFTHGGRMYRIKSSMAGIELFEQINDSQKLVGRARLGFPSYSLEFENYPEELKDLIKELSVLYILRKRVEHIAGPVQ